MVVHGLQKDECLKAELWRILKIGSQNICKLVPESLLLSSRNGKAFLVKLK